MGDRYPTVEYANSYRVRQHNIEQDVAYFDRIDRLNLGVEGVVLICLTCDGVTIWNVQTLL